MKVANLLRSLFLQAIFFVATSVHAQTQIFGVTLGAKSQLSECPYKADTITRPTLGIQFFSSEMPDREGAPTAETAELQKVRDQIRGVGVLVVKVTPSSVADKAGVLAGDIIIKIDTTATASLKNVLESLSTVDVLRDVEIRVLRQNTLQTFSGQFERPFKRYEPLPQTTCFEDFRRVNTYGKPIRRVSFGRNEAPSWLRNFSLNLLEIDGLVQGIEFFTSGLSVESVVLDRLIEKFGKPTKQSVREVRNLSGGIFQTMTAIWMTDDLLVSFEGTTDRVDSGRVTIDRPPAQQLRKLWLQPNKAELKL